MSNAVKGFIDFIDRSPSAFHAVENACAMLTEKGFERLNEHEAWNLVPGGRYFVTRNRSTVIAFTLPQGAFTHFQIVASHSDSPSFKLKPTSENAVCEKYIRLNT